MNRFMSMNVCMYRRSKDTVHPRTDGSKMVGRISRIYAQVQIKRSSTVRRLLKSKIADMMLYRTRKGSIKLGQRSRSFHQPLSSFLSVYSMAVSLSLCVRSPVSLGSLPRSGMGSAIPAIGMGREPVNRYQMAGLNSNQRDCVSLS